MFNLNFNTIDYIFLAIIGVLSIRGVFRGFITELLSMAALILGLAGAVMFSKRGAYLLEKIWGVSGWNQVVAFLFIFIVVYATVKLFENLLHNLFVNLNLEKLDRALGFFWGLGEGILVTLIILFILNWQPFFDLHALVKGSFFAKLLLPLLPPPTSISVPGEMGNV